MKTTTLPLKHSMNRLPSRLALLLIPLALVCAALSPLVDAQCPQTCNDSLSTTALGSGALVHNSSGLSSTAIGYQALYSETNGPENTAIGVRAMYYSNGAVANTAIGANALSNNTFGSFNTVTGDGALNGNTTGGYNTANGFETLTFNTTGFNNTATGAIALVGNTTGKNNTATGTFALNHNTTGNSNIALGYQAGANLTTGGNNIDIGNRGVAGETNTIRLGTQGTQTATYIAGISGATVSTGVAVMIDTDGHLGTTTSSARFKESIQPMNKESEAILALQPVTFRYKKELDPDRTPQFGLVAEQVEKVNPDLVARDEQGKPYTVRYEAVNAMLLNEFLKEHRKVEEQEARITQLKAELQATATRQQKQIEALTAGLQKVSAQIELSKSSTQTVSKNH